MQYPAEFPQPFAGFRQEGAEMAKDLRQGNRALGTPVEHGPRTWVQTERKAHEAWAQLTMKSPRAAAVMHTLVANMGHQNAVVIGQKTLAKLVGCSLRTVQYALADLERDLWIQIVQIGSSGTVNAYVINSEIAWAESRDQIHRLSVFSAQVIADATDQTADKLSRRDLRKLPLVVPPEEALPHGDGEPGAQTLLPGFEPTVPRKR